MVETMGEIMHEDVRQSPWKFPVYGLGLVFMVAAAPIPVPGAASLVPGALVVWASLRLTPRSRWAHGKIRDSFRHEALVENHRDFIQADPLVSGKYRLKNGALALSAMGSILRDTAKSGEKPKQT